MSIYNQVKVDAKVVSIEVLSKDRHGLVSEIAEGISALNYEILFHKAKVFTDVRGVKMSELKVQVNYCGEEKLNSLLHRLNKISGVVSVSAE